MSRGEAIALIIAAACAGIVATPFVIEGASSRDAEPVIAAQFVAAIAGTTAAIMLFFYRRRARFRADLRAGRHVLAQWQYPLDEWTSFVASEERTTSRARLRRIGLVLGWSAAAGFVVAAFQLEAIRWIAWVLLGMLALCALIGWLGGRADRRRRKTETPAVLIGSRGLLLRDDLHVWDGWGNQLESAALDCGGQPTVLELVYSTPNHGPRPTVTVRVPVPAGQENDALALAKRLGAAATAEPARA